MENREKKQLVVATSNNNKLKEFKEILCDKYELKSLKNMDIDIDIEENGASFMENAIIKATAIYNLTKKPTIADDSGLVVYALNGEPGIYSARYAIMHNSQLDNIDVLLNKMENLKDEDRKAAFICAVALIDANGNLSTAEGRVEGEILYKREGDKGFGYDPIFYSYDLCLSFGIADSNLKHSISHRGRALKSLYNIICKKGN